MSVWGDIIAILDIRGHVYLWEAGCEQVWFEPDLLATSFPEVNMATDVENSNYVSPDGHRPVMLGDSEGFRDRKTYAKPGGCYYSARLAVSEYRSEERRVGK